MSEVALITGCSEGGIGHAFALELRSRGFQVFATARKLENMPGLKEAGCELLTLDVTDPSSISKVVELISSKTGGRLNLLINNAGAGAALTPLLDVDIDSAKWLYDTNVWGLLRVTQAFAPLLVKTAHNPDGSTRASILNIGSVTAIRPFPFAGVYGSSKAAVHGLSDSLRSELGNLGVSVTVAVTGGVESKIIDKRTNIRAKDADQRTVYKSWARLEKIFYDNRRAKETKATPTEVYVNDVLNQLLVASPPAHIFAASYAGLLRMAGHLPAWISDKLLNRNFPVHEIQYEA